MTVIGVAAVVGTAGCAAVIVHLNSAIGDLALHERRHLDPIAVPSSACPTLGLVRVTAARAGEGWWEQIDPHPPPWDDFAAQLEPKLEQFAIALHVAIPEAPDRVAVRLKNVLREVEIGRRELPNSANVFEYLTRTDNAVLDGEQSLSDASDLVGGACGPPLYDATAIREVHL